MKLCPCNRFCDDTDIFCPKCGRKFKLTDEIECKHQWTMEGSISPGFLRCRNCGQMKENDIEVMMDNGENI